MLQGEQELLKTGKTCEAVSEGKNGYRPENGCVQIIDV
jgi:hypothetical protein